MTTFANQVFFFSLGWVGLGLGWVAVLGVLGWVGLGVVVVVFAFCRWVAMVLTSSSCNLGINNSIADKYQILHTNDQIYLQLN